MTGPQRITGGPGTGKTTELRRLATQASRPLVLCASRFAADRFGGGATTFTDLALDLLRATPGGARRLLEPPAQVEVVATLLRDHASWPGLEVDPRRQDFASELAHTVCLYQASFLGDEELRVHADAAGQLERWDALARFTARYLDAIRDLGAVDWGGAVVGAALALREPAFAAAQRARWDLVVVDDYERASFATNRLLSLLVGRGGNVVVAGDFDGPTDPWRGGSRRHLRDFLRRFGGEADGVLSARHRPSPAREEGAPGGGVPVDVSDLDGVTGGEWPVVDVFGWPGRHEEARWFDPHLFGGPDVPDAEERRDRFAAEQERRLAYAIARATERAIVVTDQTAVQPPSTASTWPVT